MCGIWGVFNKRPSGYLPSSIKDLGRTMTIMSSLRGDHSTGMCVVPQTPYTEVENPYQPRVAKTVGGPFAFLHTEVGNEFLQWTSTHGRILFGHNRHATRGRIVAANAHPFRDGPWILVHNGTIHAGLNHGLEGEPEVDSHALCMKINEVGLKQALLSIDGAYAILAYNTETKKMYAARNAERTLFHCNWGDYEYVMSEENMLIFSLMRHNVITHQNEKSIKISQFEINSIYELTENGFIKTEDVKKPLPPPVVTKHYDYSGTSKRNNVVTQMPVVDPPAGKIGFLVDTIEKRGGQYRYNCIADFIEDGEVGEVFFLTSFNRPDLIGKYGEAEINLKYADEFSKNRDKNEYHVKYRDIEWISELDREEGDPVGPNPKSLLACCSCAEEITEDNKGVPVLGSGYMCKTCVSEYVHNNGTVYGSTMH